MAVTNSTNFCNVNENLYGNCNNASNVNGVRPRFYPCPDITMEEQQGIKGAFIRPPKAETTLPMPSVMAAKAVTSGDLQIYLDAFEACKKNSIWKSSVQLFNRDKLQECTRLANDVANGTYKITRYKEFDICERGKKRHIKAPAIRDRVLCHVLCQNILLPRILPTLIYDNSASIKGKGISFARRRILAHLHRYYASHGNAGYILQTDFSSFFDSIPHDLLFEAFKQFVPEPNIQALIHTIIASYGKNGVGVGIGSELSQIAGLLYPSPVDTYCKTICQCKYYARYMDDIYIIHPDKTFLQDVFKRMQKTAEALRLAFNPKKCHIARIDKGFTYLKGNYRLTETGKVLCSPHRKTLTRERHRLKRMPKEALLEAYKAWRGNILRQFPTMPYQTLQNFDRLYGGIQHDIPTL